MGSPDSREINFVRCLKCFKVLTCSRYDTTALLEHIRTDHPEIVIIDTDTKQQRSPPMKRRNNLLDNTKQSNDSDNQIREYRCADEDCISPYKDHNVRYENNQNEQNEEHHWPRQTQYVKDIDLNKHCNTAELLQNYPEIKESEFSPYNPNAQVIYTRRYKLSSASANVSMNLYSPAKRFKYYSSIEKWRPAFGSIYCPKCGMTKKPLIRSKGERFTNSDCGACCLLSCWPFCFIPWLIPGQNVEYLHCANCKTFLGLYNPTTNSIKPNRLFTPTGKDGHCIVRQKKSFKNITNDHDHNLEKGTQILHTSAPECSSGGDTYSSPTTSERLPSITINGRELPPETVARLQKYKKYSSMLGIDFDALPENESPAIRNDRDDEKTLKQKQDASIANKDNNKDDKRNSP